MSSSFTVEPGDSIQSISFAKGFSPDTIWLHPNNRDLKTRRSVDGSRILHPGDIVFIPEKRKRIEQVATESRHTFRRKNVPTRLRVRFSVNEIPIANEPYTMNVDGNYRDGVTDPDGWLDEAVMPSR